MLRSFIQLYKRQVDKRPLITQILTAGKMITVSDIITQQLIERKKTHDFRRTVIMGSCGLFYFGPLNGKWLLLLSRSKFPAIVCVALDQVLFSPPLLSGFLGIQSILTGKSPAAAYERVKRDLFSILKASWVVWIPAQAVNFSVIPFQFRMLFLQIIALIWNCYLSNKANVQKKGENHSGKV